ncbi:MAG: hypothetical protein WCK57_00765 [Verrucomicrobiae bacterium]
MSEIVELANAAAREQPLFWLEMYGRILNKAGQLVEAVPNPMQRELGEIYDYCHAHGIPCRIVGLKARQTGLSTGSTAIGYHHMRARVAKGCIIGDEYEKSVKNLVQMFERYAENDGFGWGNTFRPQNGKFSHGSELVTETANDPRAGASGTLQFLLGTEVAHWPETGVRSAAQVLASILNCVPELPDTVVILESTPAGASGVFYETYQGAVTFDEFKAGKRGNGYIRIFYPWFMHPEYEVELSYQEKAEVMGSMTGREKEIAERYGLRAGHVEFRRRTLASPKFRGDEKLFDQEYPPDDVECFLTSGRPRFDQSAISAMDRWAKAQIAQFGNIECVGNRLMFRRTSESEGWARIWEMPRNGKRYLIAVDPMTGASQTGGKNPDCHAAMVIREGFLENGRYSKPKVVARVFPGCQVELDMLADMVAKLAGYFGNCLIVPEANNSGLAVIELWKQMDVSIYEREIFNFRESKMTKALGWQTRDGAGRDGTRSIAIGNLAALIREGGIEIPCQHILEECRTFVLNDSGKAEAMRGKHDDDVLALAIGVTCIEGATTYRQPVLTRDLPADLRSLERDRRGKSRVMTYA